MIGSSEWAARVADRSLHLGIIGLGYVGLPLTLLFAEEGFRVTGFDIDPSKVASLNAGDSYIQRIEPEQIRAAQAVGFHATGVFPAIASVDAILICVPTPLHDDHTPDMSFVVSTVEAIAPYLQSGQLVILESTTYPGTTEEIVVPILERHRGRVLRDGATGAGIMVAFSPEREDPGNTTIPRREVPKVIGGVDCCATEAAAALYGAVFSQTVTMSSPAAAEMTKLLENIYRCVNIALINELKQLCQAMGLDIWEIVAAAATKPFGFQAFYPGPGVGGHCIPVDPFYLSWKAREFGVPTRFIELAGEVNEAMPAYVVQATMRALQREGIALAQAKVLVLGIAYKRDVDDLRESPSLRVMDLLRRGGAAVSYNDPYFPFVGRGRHYDLQMESVSLDDIGEYDCVVIVTDHTVYNYPDLVARARLVVDSRNATKAIRGADAAKIVRC